MFGWYGLDSSSSGQGLVVGSLCSSWATSQQGVCSTKLETFGIIILKRIWRVRFLLCWPQPCPQWAFRLAVTSVPQVETIGHPWSATQDRGRGHIEHGAISSQQTGAPTPAFLQNNGSAPATNPAEPINQLRQRIRILRSLNKSCPKSGDAPICQGSTKIPQTWNFCILFLISGSTQHREYNWGATWKKN
jgi:hypothetical protein